MNILGIDFTSRPTPAKPITCLVCRLQAHELRFVELQAWTDFAEFEAMLAKPGPWIAGCDFPFGFARRFIENIGWPDNWAGYMTHLASMTRNEYREALDDYRQCRPAGDKEHRRATDIATGAISPQKLYGTPVALMLYEGAPRLLRAGVHVPGLYGGDPERVVLETYPGVLARALIGRRSYKQDRRTKQTAAQAQSRMDLLRMIQSGALQKSHGLNVVAPDWLADDPGGDQLDALLCAIEAAWSWSQGRGHFGLPQDVDPLEGWIAHPA